MSMRFILPFFLWVSTLTFEIPHRSIRASSSLQADPRSDRIKKAGGGIALIPSTGDRSLFDPAVEGKLGGTDDLDERLRLSFDYLAAPPTEDAQHWLEDIGVPTNFAKPTQPVTATVMGRGRLISEVAPGDIQHM